MEPSRKTPPAPPMTRPRVTRLAQNVSHLISPPIVGGAVAWSVARSTATTSRDALQWLIPYWCMICIAPVAFIAILFARGKVTDLHLALRRQRIMPIVVSLVCTLFTWFLFQHWDAPVLMQRLVLINLMQLAILAGVTVIWQISFHGAAVGAAVAVSYALFGPAAALTVPPAALASWSRVYLRRHTLTQVIAGATVGVAVAGWVMSGKLV